jgi:signal peptidase I
MKQTYATRSSAASPDSKSKVETPKEAKKEGNRETVEAIVVAMILALLVRGFEAEAFVIPTGSMAPTLMGRHKEVTCPQCGYVYAVNASSEDDGGRSMGIAGLRLSSQRGRSSVVSGTCVNCRYQAPVADAPTFNGDRILVMKFPYDMPFLPGASPPQRWDVVVFRYPEEPEVSYIKRLVGLPGEELRIWHGDIFIKRPGANAFQLERKPLEHQAAMAMMVYDDTHRPKALNGKPEWLRWSSRSATAWREESPGTFTVSAPAGQEAELRYRHLVPDPEQWDAILNDQEPPRPPRSTLVTDFYSYNTNQSAGSRGDFEMSSWMQPHWVGDLTVSANLKVTETKGIVRFELVEGGIVNRCEIDLAEGVANLYHGGKPLNEGRSPKFIDGPGTYEVTFANVDDRLTLLVDGRPIFGDGLTYEDGAKTHPIPTQADLSPVGITAEGASVAVSDLVLKRDIYYTLNPGLSDYRNLWDERYPRNPIELFDNLADPSRFAFLANLPPKDYPIGQDRFLMLGDNSPMSKDSRGWNNEDRRVPDIPIEEPNAGWDESNRASWEVPRDMLTGKAFFVYWPHGKPVGPDIRISRDFRVPFRPYVERMKWIR